MKTFTRPAIVLLFLAGSIVLFATPLAEARTIKFKLATLAPPGSNWHKLLKEMAQDWDEVTNGRVKAVIQTSTDDEPAIVRKLSLGRLHAAALTSAGLIDLNDQMSALAIPMFYASREELRHVMGRMEAHLQRGLADRKIKLLHWSTFGTVYFFSRHPVQNIADLKAQKIFVWAGDSQLARFWERNGYQPVELASTDVYVALETGFVDVVYISPLAANALNWYRSARHLLDFPIGPIPGGTVIHERTWERISAEDRAKMQTIARRYEERIFREIPRADIEAIEAMQKRGLTLHTLDEAGRQGFRLLGAQFTEAMRDEQVPKVAYDLALKYRSEYRKRNSVVGVKEPDEAMIDGKEAPEPAPADPPPTPADPSPGPL